MAELGYSEPAEDVIEQIRRLVSSVDAQSSDDILVLSQEMRVYEAGQPKDKIAPHEIDLQDDDALRGLVSEMVREELSGALGMKVTRSIRKLVRKEINEALAARDLT
ncbi:hypothetical protein [Palleronia caenipelagi]|uniref:Uncharacterized protein n=1 Tax=Palleronia caenipelagi TaxID=2489174 RepID=A0A547PY08_9RHOB|nr:hypothetical protein [Palleronia caenipelagi]TRD19035.1 hypothetical protein FEV53_11125 [Palleronia caenipelagi]